MRILKRLAVEELSISIQNNNSRRTRNIVRGTCVSVGDCAFIYMAQHVSAENGGE
jgi:hypothetical protein